MEQSQSSVESVPRFYRVLKLVNLKARKKLGVKSLRRLVYQRRYFSAMDKIQNLIPTILIETANKYAKAKEEECKVENEEFRKNVISSVKSFSRDIVMVSIIVILIITGFLFLREDE